MVSIDFFTVPNITMKVLYVFIVLETPASRGAALQCDGASDGGLDFPTDRRGLWRPRSAALSAPRQGWRVRQRCSSANCVAADRGSTHGAANSLAESVRRTPDRFHSERLFEPLRDPQLPASEENARFLFRVLS